MIRRLRELQVAVAFLTRLPAGRIGGTAPSIAEAGWALPLVGAFVGAAGWLVLAVAAACGLPPTLCALLAVAFAIGATGGLHEDGLADFADGVGGGRDRAHKLEIMRDSRIGSYGVLVLIVAISARVLAIAELSSGGAVLAAFVATGAASRAGMLVVLGAMPPARAEGLGRSAGAPGGPRVIGGLLLGAAFLLPLGGAAWQVAAAVALAASGMAVVAQRQVGGQTGDVLGAVQVVGEVAGWLALAAVGGRAP